MVPFDDNDNVTKLCLYNCEDTTMTVYFNNSKKYETYIVLCSVVQK